MAQKKSSAIILLVLISFTCAQLDTKTTTETPIDPSSTTESTTSKLPDTTSSIFPPTTQSTTSSATTTTVTTSTSTTTPGTTTTRPPTPSPDYKKWSYTSNNETCVIVQLALQFNLTYNTSDDKQSNVLYNVPVNESTVAGGSCDKDNQSITIQWRQSKMVLQFTANASASEFMLSKIYVLINATQEFSDAKAKQLIELYHVNNDYVTPLAMSYHCNKLQTITFTSSEDSKEIISNATVSHVQLEAFHKENSDQFSTGRDCEAIDTPDIVPIAVGCALGGLVVVVLIAYLTARRRAQARGYLSM